MGYLDGGFLKLGGTILGVPIIRTIVYLGSKLGSPYFGKLPNTPHDVVPTSSVTGSSALMWRLWMRSRAFQPDLKHTV